MEYRVIVEEGFSCMGGDETVAESVHPTYEAAVRRCEQIVREELQNLAREGFSGEALLRAYDLRGVQPFVLPVDGPPFDAAAYARLAADDL